MRAIATTLANTASSFRMGAIEREHLLSAAGAALLHSLGSNGFRQRIDNDATHRNCWGIGDEIFPNTFSDEFRPAAAYGWSVDEATQRGFLEKVRSCYARLLVAARWEARAYGGRHCTDEELRRRARELLHETVDRLLRGKRAMPPDDIDFATSMKWQLRSVAESMWKQDRRLDSIDAESETPDGKVVPTYQFSADDRRILDYEQAADLANDLLEAAADDERCSQVVLALLEDGCNRPADVAVYLGIPTKDVYIAQRKLLRRFLASGKKVP